MSTHKSPDLCHTPICVHSFNNSGQFCLPENLESRKFYFGVNGEGHVWRRNQPCLFRTIWGVPYSTPIFKLTFPKRAFNFFLPLIYKKPPPSPLHTTRSHGCESGPSSSSPCLSYQDNTKPGPKNKGFSLLQPSRDARSLVPVYKPTVPGGNPSERRHCFWTRL